jgi:uncharacterized protein YqfA (UPF0365 family)
MVGTEREHVSHSTMMAADEISKRVLCRTAVDSGTVFQSLAVDEADAQARTGTGQRLIATSNDVQHR